MISTIEKPQLAEHPSNKLGLLDPISGRKRRVKASSWPNFYSTLGLMVSSGVSVINALAEVAKKNEDPGLARHLRSVIHDINRGVSLPQAFKNNLPNFPVFHYELLSMAVNVGKLDEALRYLADYEENNQRNRLQLRAALTYPLLQASMAFLLLSLAPAHFEESFVQTLAAVDRDLPLPVFLFCRYSWFMNYFLLTLLAVGLVLLLPPIRERILDFFAQDVVAKRLRWLSFMGYRYSRFIPGLGKALRVYSQERFTRALGLQLEAGRPLAPSVRAAFKITGDPFFLEVEDRVVQDISDGETVTSALESTGLFDEVAFLSFLKAGEESGTIADLLLRSADFQSRDFSTTLQQAMSLLNPILLLVVGGLVATMVFSVFVPLIQLTQAL